MTEYSPIQIVAHRGYSAVAPENTLKALAMAVEAGVEAVEFDVQTAACGTPVLFHDQMLGRTTNGVGPLKRRPLAHLKILDAGSWFGPEFAHEKIPTLEEALDLLSGRVDEIYLDVKGYREMEDLDRIVMMTRATGTDDQAVLVSSDWVIMNRFRQVAGDIRRAYLVEERYRFPEALDRAAVDEGSLLSVSLDLARERPEGLEEAQSAGVELVIWTVDDPETAEWAISAGARRILTNEVGPLMEWRDSRSQVDSPGGA